MGKTDLEGNVCGLIALLFMKLPGRNEENYEKPQSG
jgi:hypothetical protein